MSRRASTSRRPQSSPSSPALASSGLSRPEASPPGFWYDQDWTEWVVVLSGSAGVKIEGEDKPRILAPGGYLEIPPHVRHRVEWTDADEPTVWLAVHAK